MKHTLDQEGAYAILRLQEENFNAEIVPEVKQAFEDLHGEGVNNLILNLEDVRYLDSTALGSILLGNRLWKNRGSFILTEVNSDHVKRTFHISGLERFLVIQPSEEEAITYLKDVEEVFR